MLDINKIPNYSEKIEFLKSTIKSIPDYPKPGIMFRDVTSLCENGQAFATTIDLLYEIYKDDMIDKVVAAEARGFVFGAALAYKLNAGFVMVRKPGKLPRQTIEEVYELEYGTNKLQLHEDSLNKGEKVLLVDDLLATGGTIEAMASLVGRLGAKIIDIAFIIELMDLGGAKRIEQKFGIKPFSLFKLPGH